MPGFLGNTSVPAGVGAARGTRIPPLFAPVVLNAGCYFQRVRRGSSSPRVDTQLTASWALLLPVEELVFSWRGEEEAEGIQVLLRAGRQYAGICSSCRSSSGLYFPPREN